MKYSYRILAIIFLWLQTALAAGSDFVTVSGKKMIYRDHPYYYCGVNFWYGMNLASQGSGGDRDRLERELDNLAALGLRNLRVMAASEGPETEKERMVPPLQISPDVYDEEVLDGLDYLLYAMGQRGMHAVMCLNNFWHWSGGFAQYVRWNGGGSIPYPTPDDWRTYMVYAATFYTNNDAVTDYRNHIEVIVNRVNSYSDLAYKNDPTIIAWELANEPRCIFQRASDMGNWIDETATFIKSLDTNHLVTTGIEGLEDSIADVDFTNIDYSTIHIWPQNWRWYDPQNAQRTYDSAIENSTAMLNGLVSIANILDKPLVLEEFGLARDNESYNPASSTAWRDRYYQDMFDLVYASASTDGPLCGDNIWAWSGEGRPEVPYGGTWSAGDDWIGDPPHERQGWYGVYNTDSTTIQVLRDHAARMNLLAGTGTIPHNNQGVKNQHQASLKVQPASGRHGITVSAVLPTGYTTATLEVFDMLGTNLLTVPVQGTTVRKTISLMDAACSSGMYLVRLRWHQGRSLQTRFVWMQSE